MILELRKENKGLFFRYKTSGIERKGWLKDSLNLPDLIHAIKPSKVIVLDRLKPSKLKG